MNVVVSIPTSSCRCLSAPSHPPVTFSSGAFFTETEITYHKREQSPKDLACSQQRQCIVDNNGHIFAKLGKNGV
jgi:hypothetical protein